MLLPASHARLGGDVESGAVRCLGWGDLAGQCWSFDCESGSGAPLAALDRSGGFRREADAWDDPSCWIGVLSDRLAIALGELMK